VESSLDRSSKLTSVYAEAAAAALDSRAEISKFQNVARPSSRRRTLD